MNKQSSKGASKNNTTCNDGYSPSYFGDTNFNEGYRPGDGQRGYKPALVNDKKTPPPPPPKTGSNVSINKNSGE